MCQKPVVYKEKTRFRMLRGKCAPDTVFVPQGLRVWKEPGYYLQREPNVTSSFYIPSPAKASSAP